MARWKIVDSIKAEELGIEEVNPDSEGLITVDIYKIPPGLSVRDVIDLAEREGILLQTSI